MSDTTTTTTAPEALTAEALTAEALTAEALTKIQACGRDFSKADTDRAFALHNFMRAIGDAPTFVQWESARKALISGYRETKPAANDAACDTWFSRYIKALKAYIDENGFEMKIPSKPKAESPEAVKKAAQRANPYADKPKAEIEAAIATLTGDDVESAKLKLKAAEALQKVQKAEAAAAEKAAADTLKPRREALQKAIKAAPAHVLVLFEAVADMTAENASAEAVARAWAVLEAVAPKAKAPKAPKAPKTRRAA